jgi:hypothetical protein
MNSDFGEGSDKILCIMVNLSALNKKIEKEFLKEKPDQKKLNVWEIEKRKVQSALDKRRIMA